MSVLGMLAIGGVQAQSGNGGSALLKTLPMEQAGIVSNLRDAGPAHWDLANAATDYAGGTGTEADPYQIETPQQLMKLCVDATGEAAEDGSFGLVLSGKYFKQTADIDLSGAYANLICIGVQSYFAGHYDGNGYKIKGFNVLYEDQPFSEGSIYSHGLFLNVYNGSLKNIVMEDAKLTVNNTQANYNMLVYSFLAGNAYNSKIENCQVSGTIDFNVSGKNVSILVGGIAANTSAVEIDNCRADGSMNLKLHADGEIVESSSAIFSGGIIGQVYGDSKISNCINNMDITSEVNGTAETGLVIKNAGLVGWCENLKLLNSANTGDIQSTGSNTIADKTWVQTAGLIAGASSATVDNCWNASKVTSIGGVAEEPASPFVCYVTNDVTYTNCSFDKLLFTEPCDKGSAMETSEMQSPNFVETLNANLPEGALEWKYVEGAYPILGEAQEEPEDPTANESVTASETILRVLPGAVVVTSPEAVEFAAYTFSGAMQANELLPAGTSTVNLPAGLYILKVGDETYKVNVK